MSPPPERPALVVIAGPNGAGKTTLKAFLDAKGVEFGPHINPDEIALALQGDGTVRARAAQTRADRARARYLARGISFSFETVMSHPSKVDFMRRARAQGYFVVLHFIGVEDPAISVARVADRVAKGGHDVPEDRVRARYKRTMSLLAEAARAADRTYVFDNSGPPFRRERRRLCAALDEGRLTIFANPLPAWVQRYFVEALARASS